MNHSLKFSLDQGFSRPVRYRLGEGVNVWGDGLNSYARKLDDLHEQITPEVAQVLRDLFTEIGQLTRDLWSAEPVHESLNVRLGKPGKAKR